MSYLSKFVVAVVAAVVVAWLVVRDAIPGVGSGEEEADGDAVQNDRPFRRFL